LTIPCIIALNKESLLRLTIANLFRNSANELTVIESDAENLDALIREINQFKANIILVENSSPFADEPSLTKLLILYPQLLVIVIQEDNNWLHIFRKENKLLTSATDLLDVINSAQNQLF